MQKLFTILFFSFCFSSSIFSQNNDSLRVTLEEAKAYAVLHSNDIKQNAFEVERARLIVKQATAALLPQVSGDASYTYYTKVPTNAIPANSFTTGLENTFIPIITEINSLRQANDPNAPPFSLPPPQDGDILFPLGQRNSFAAKISLYQTLFNGVYLIGLQGAKMFIELTKAQNDVKNVDVGDNVTRAYYGALISRENVRIISENIANLERLLYETTQIYKQGFAEQLDVDRLTLSLATLRSQVDGLKAQAVLAETNLKFQMGYPVDKQIALNDKLDNIVAKMNPLVDSTPEFNARKEVHLMDIQENINKIKVKKEKYQYLPTVMGFAALGSTGQRDKFSEVFANKWQNYHYVGLQVHVTIWDNFAIKRQYQQTQIDIEKIKLGKIQMQEGFRLQYQKAKIDFESAYRDVQVQKDNVALAQKIYDVAQKKYKEGVGSSLEMTQAEVQYYTTQAQYLGSVYKALIAKTDIQKSLGTE
jgi:outer membrane protein TolC